MSNRQPLVSICIPTYNSARYLAETLESIVSQSWPRLEVIIADNASTDATLAIANTFADRHGWRVLRSDINLGPFGNWNRLIQAATGEYVAIYHSDDVYLPTMVEESLQLLEQNADLGLVGTLATIMDGEGRKQGVTSLPRPCVNTEQISFDQVFLNVLECGGKRIFPVTPSIMVRRRIYNELGLFDVSGCFGSAGDYEMWLKIAVHYPLAVIPRPLMRYRIHQGQGSENELRRNLALPDIMTVLKKYADMRDDPILRAAHDRFRDRTHLKTALKQNCAGEYEWSGRTAGQIIPGRYWLAGRIVGLANRLRFSLRYWPGHPWPFRVNDGETRS